MLQECAYARIAHFNAAGQPVGTVLDYFYPSWKKQSEGKMAFAGRLVRCHKGAVRGK